MQERPPHQKEQHILFNVSIMVPGMEICLMLAALQIFCMDLFPKNVLWLILIWCSQPPSAFPNIAGSTITRASLDHVDPTGSPAHSPVEPPPMSAQSQSTRRKNLQFRRLSLPSVPNSNEWEHYCRRQLKDGQTAYVCIWKFQQRSQEIVCNYKSKKQLVKRHIQATHLKYK